MPNPPDHIVVPAAALIALLRGVSSENPMEFLVAEDTNIKLKPEASVINALMHAYKEQEADFKNKQHFDHEDNAEAVQLEFIIRSTLKSMTTDKLQGLLDYIEESSHCCSVLTFNTVNMICEERDASDA